MRDSILRSDAAKRAPAPVVIFRLGSLGDTIVALPCLHKIADTFAANQRLILTNIPVSAKAAPLLSILGEDGQIVHGAIEYPVGTRSPKGLFALARKLRSLGFDTLVYLMPQRSRLSAWCDYFFFRLCGFKHILAFPDSDDLRTTRIGADGIEKPEAERLTRCCAADFGPVDLSDPKSRDLNLTDRELAAGQACTAPLQGTQVIAVNMGGKAAEKDWGIENWLSLMERLGRRFADFGLLVIDGPPDAPQGDVLARAWPGPSVNARGKLSPREGAAALTGAACFIGHDSGPLHLAAASQVPSGGLFGNYNRPKKWHPIDPHVRVIHKMAGIKAIQVDDVEDAVLAQLAGTGHGQEPRQQKVASQCDWCTP